jgi:hypothetical protein
VKKNWGKEPLRESLGGKNPFAKVNANKDKNPLLEIIFYSEQKSEPHPKRQFMNYLKHNLPSPGGRGARGGGNLVLFFTPTPTLPHQGGGGINAIFVIGG